MKPSGTTNKNPHLRAQAVTGYLFTIPSFAGLIVFVLYPLLQSVLLSFSKTNLFTEEIEFVGLSNYVKLFHDHRAYTIFGNTFWYAVFCPIGITLLGLLLAVALDDKMGKAFTVLFRSIYFFPSLVGLVFVAIIWQYILQKDTGILNFYLSAFGIPKVGWLSDPNLSKVSVWILDVWKNIGMSMLLLLAGLQSIGKDYYEAARIDGASGINAFFRITLPLVSPTLLFVYITNLTGALRIFESVQVLTGGGPGDSSRSLTMFIWEKAFKSYDYGTACSLAVLLLIVTAGLTVFQFIASRKWVYYE